ncbi:MAG: hypothetical protein QOJ56_654 [Mycobacterium sp.]|jgi:hypothetical protein|nr:hypothetical protein [Mycobacterium sp.]
MLRRGLLDNNDGDMVGVIAARARHGGGRGDAEPEREIEQLRAEVELLKAGHHHDPRRTTGFPDAGDRRRWM